MPSYKNMEEIIKAINSKYVSLKDEEVKRNNELLKATLERMISIMKDQDPIFKLIFNKPFFGGSYYDDLKVGKPDEFDLDLLLIVPQLCEIDKRRSCDCVSVVSSDKPGFLWFTVKEGHCSLINRFIKDEFMQTDLLLNWLKSSVTKALNSFDYFDPDVNFSFGTPKYQSESGPALTLQLLGPFGEFNVDLVPAFTFGSNRWPSSSYLPNPTETKPDFFIVPKKARNVSFSERYWRCSFQDQERWLLNGKERLKPALRLLKKMRNNLIQSSVSSYALKTMTLWELKSGSANWNESLSDTFMRLLKKYQECLSQGYINYYWNNQGNLLDTISRDTLINHGNEIKRAINKIDRNYETDPTIIAKVILKEGSEEYILFMKEYGRRNNSTSASIQGIEETSSLVSDSQTFTSGIGTAAKVMLGVGVVAAAGLAIFGAFNRNNNRNNN